MDGTKSIPRMRTAAKIVAEIKALDPDTEMTEFHIRQMAKDGTVPVVWAGRKALINLDDVLDLMRQGMTRPTEEAAPAAPPAITAGQLFFFIGTPPSYVPVSRVDGRPGRAAPSTGKGARENRRFSRFFCRRQEKKFKLFSPRRVRGENT